MKSPIFLIALLFIGFILHSNAQEVSTKWKDITEKDFNPEVENKYPDAPAVVLFDIGEASFKVVNNELKLIYERHIRTKILNREGYERANIEIPFYAHENYEEVSSIQGFTYTLANGKVKKEKLKNNDIYDENIDERWHQIKFSMPAVQAGSVIEYRYRITSSDFIDFRNWVFQRSIPVQYSKFTTSIPEYFRYATVFQGMEDTYSKNEESYQDYFEFFRERTAGNRAMEAHRSKRVNSSGYNDNSVRIDHQVLKTEYIMQDIPALKDVPYVSSLSDYIATLRFQLAEKNIPGVSHEKYYTNWEDLSSEMLKHERIGKQLNRNNRVKKQTEEVIAGIEDPEEKIRAIYNFVSKSMQWDGFYRYAVYDQLKTAFDQKQGNSAEINLILTLMLREAGFESHPVLVSTRSNGKVLQAYPVINQFNHVINYTRINDQVYLMDAIDKNIPHFLIPEDDLNGSGFVMKEDAPFWVELKNDAKNINRTSIIASFDKDLNMVLENENMSVGYPAVKKLSSFSGNEDDYFNHHYSKKVNDFRADTFHFETKNSNTSEYLKFRTKDFANSSGDMLYIQPMLFYGEDDNPFKRETRKIPVDFTYPYENTFVLNLNLPEGYQVVESPKSIKLLLPNSGGEFLYYFAQNGNNIQVICTLKIKKQIYSAEEYPYLKQLFGSMVAKHKEQIVLKKDNAG